MLPRGLREHLGDGKETPSRMYSERLKKYYETNQSESNDTTGEFIGDCRLPTTITRKDIFDLQQNLVPRSTDVFVVTYPKCGTTWMQQIVKLIWNNGVEDNKDVDEVIPWVEPMKPAETEAMPSPRGFKSHLPFHLCPGGDPLKSPAKYIYVYRNPKDALVSNYHFSVKFYPDEMPWSEYFDIITKGQQYFGIIFDHIHSWYNHRDAPNILIISYESLKRDLSTAVRRVATFLDYKLSDEIMERIVKQTSFEKMKENPACNNSWYDKYRRPGELFMRKGVIGDWRNLFTPEQSAYVDSQVAKILKPTGIVFDYGDI